VGNAALIDRVGQTFSRLTVLSRAENDKNGNTHWLCQCECGTEHIVQSNNLTSGAITSCGCLRREKAALRLLGKPSMRRKRPFGAIYTILYSAATKRNIPVELTYEEFVEFTKITSCHYCSYKLTWSAHGNHRKKDSMAYNLDRMDSSKSYSIENCIPCCAPCNRGKMDNFTYDEWYKRMAPLRKESDKELPIALQVAQ
jgi:hypothetical protein